MKQKLIVLITLLACSQWAWCQNTLDQIRHRYQSYKEYIDTHKGTNMNDGGEWAEYYHLEARQMLPGSGGHIEDVYMYWEEKGEGDEDLIYPPHILTFATKKYNFAARKYYEEYLFDSEGKLQFVYGYDPMWAPDESAEDEQYEFRFYLNKGKLIKAVIKKRADDNQPYKEVFSGTALKGAFSKKFSEYGAGAEALKLLFGNIEKEAYNYR